MASQYWSNTKFADALREVFGIAKQPIAASLEEWDEYEICAKKANRIGYEIIESLNKIQRIVNYPKTVLTNGIYFISNVRRGSNVLRTSTKLGQYSDLVTKISDALMFSVIDFVEEECFWMNAMSDSCTDKDVKRYYNQTYLRRKLFPIKIDSETRGKYGIAWLMYQIEEGYSTEDEKINSPYSDIIAAYNFAKEKYFVFDSYEESGFNKLPSSGIRSSPEQIECFKTIRKLEDEFYLETTKHCSNIVKFRNFMWT